MTEALYQYAQHPAVLTVAASLATMGLYLWRLEAVFLRMLKTLLGRLIPAADAGRLLKQERWLLRLLLLLVALHALLAFSPSWAILPLNRVLDSLFLLVLFIVLIKAVLPIFDALEKKRPKSSKAMAPAVKYFLSRGIIFLLVFALATSLLDLWGVNVAALLGGLGLVGMAAALAAKDSLENIFAGLTIIGSKIFKIGDRIKIGDTQGVVEFIGLRITHIRGFDDALQFVPNSRLVSDEVCNFGKMRRRRVNLQIGLVYGTTAHQLRTIRSRIKEYLAEDEAVDSKRTCLVDFIAYGDSAIILDLYYFTISTEWHFWREVRNRHIIDFKRIVEETGSSFAFPTRTVHLLAEPEKEEDKK